MIKILVKFFIPNYQNIQDYKVREGYGVLGGILGIICNLFLFGLKLFVGFAMNSIAIISDAFNNLSDLGSSLVTVIGTKLSNAKPDKEHPFGHGRIEYISSLIVSFLIILVGFELLKTSFSKIINPVSIYFNTTLILILCLSVLVKVWMFSYNRYLFRQIQSGILKATAQDSLNDVIATSSVILATVIGNYINIPADGIIGLLVSIMIIYSGYTIARDTIGILLGTPPSDELVKNIENTVLEQEGIVGVHDLIVHDYGPGRVMASIHAEVPIDVDIVKIHEVIDKTELLIFKEYGIHMLIHMDPIVTTCAKTAEIKSLIESILIEFDQNLSIHDFRMTDGEELINLIFDLVVPIEMKKEKREEIIRTLTQKLKEHDSRFQVVIQVDNSF